MDCLASYIRKELERLIAATDNRQSYLITNLPDDAVAALEKEPQAPLRPEPDHLMQDR